MKSYSKAGWHQAWLAPDMMIANLNVNIPSALQNASVADLVDETGDWNWNVVVSDMYNILCEFNNIEDSLRWNKVWKLHVPERVRCFVWLLLYEWLLTNSRKSSMGLGHAMCRFCGDTVENELHAIRDSLLNAVDDTSGNGSRTLPGRIIGPRRAIVFSLGLLDLKICL
ncbi:hypothetical protein TSUD_332620 [Trifolium subterraneum]|uniref:Reverse transcriptase zinc-binding domain-containing protein n=1 Tax=Trifolium subterraneum TaxID=3900 RepID=A0A2Z6NNM0_TRISU|nr:hypothetical protein TSUD_332620 [Trifolium subterraneum]